MARELGCVCISREDLIEQAIQLGVPADTLEAAMSKPPRFYRQMEAERNQYLACLTMLLTEQILRGDVVYYGHAAHMLLCGIPNILRIRVLAHPEFRITSVIRTMGLSREEAKEYIRKVDEEREKWVRFLYGVDWNDPALYDIVVHLDQMGLNNAVVGLKALAKLPDFALNSETEEAIKNLYLASKAHFELTKDPRTNIADVRVSADNGVVQVTYPPLESKVAMYVSEVLSRVPEIKAVNTTIADRSILFLQDEFSCDDSNFREVAQVAKKWDAAVELMRYAPSDRLSTPDELLDELTASKNTAQGKTDSRKKPAEPSPFSLKEYYCCLAELRRLNCLGGSSAFCGNAKALVTRIHRNRYDIIVLGELFRNRSEATRRRLKDELKNYLNDNINVPIVEVEELQRRFRITPGQVLKIIVGLFISAAMLVSLFHFQREVLAFLSGEQYKAYRLIAAIGVMIVTPLFAYSYGTLTRQVLRLFWID